MAYLNIEQQIEDHIFAVLNAEQTDYGVETFYPTASNDELLNHIQTKASVNPSAFFRVVGTDFENLSTLGDVENGTVNIEIICASPKVRKQAEIRGTPRHVNAVISDVITRLKENAVILDEETTHEFVLRSVRDLFTTLDLDVRVIQFQLEGVVIDV
jgi:hypothetical protein